MPLDLECPGCGEKFQVKDSQEGKRVTCSSCQEEFVAKGTGKLRKPQSDDKPTRRRDEDEDRPRRRRDEDEDDRPRRRGRDDEDRPAARRRQRSKDDEDEEGPPRRRQRKESGSGVGTVLVVLGVCLLVVCGGGAAAIWALFFRTPGMPKYVARRVIWNYDGKHVQGKRLEVPANANGQVLVLTERPFGAFKRQVDRLDAVAGKALNTVNADGAGGHDILGVSPDGSLLLVRAVHFGSSVNVWSLNDSRHLAQNWKVSYTKQVQPGNRDENVDASWMSLLDNKRLLAIYADGAIDVWDIATRQRTAWVAERKAAPHLRPQILGGGVPRNFALSPDRRLLAYWNGDGLDLIDTRTGKLKQTKSVGAPAGGQEVTGVACNHDGSEVVVDLTLAGVRTLLRFSARNGKQLARWTMPVTNTPAYGGMVWWGKSHILILETSGMSSNLHLINVEKGRYTGQVVLGGLFGRPMMATDSPDGRLWTVFLPIFGGEAAVLAFDVPTEELSAMEATNPNPNNPPKVSLSRDGVERQ
jgi:hypothetical protein